MQSRAARPPLRPRFDRGPAGRGLRAAGAAWRWGSSLAARSAVTAPQARPQGSRRAAFYGRCQAGSTRQTVLSARGGTVRRAPGRISGGWMLSTRISTRRDENGRAARAASMVWCCLGQHFAPPQLSCESPCAAPASALRVPVPLPSVLPSPAGQDRRSWARPAASGSPVCPSPGFWASSQVCCPFSRPCAASRTRPAAAPARLHAGPCRSQHHHPSPGHPPTSISTLLTRASAVRASFLPFPCALSSGLVRRFQRPLRL